MGPLERTLFLACFVASRRNKSTLPVLRPMAIRSSREGSGDQAKHCKYMVSFPSGRYYSNQVPTFMNCRSCCEVTCRISGWSGAHSYSVISVPPPTTNLFSLRGCHSKRFSGVCAETAGMQGSIVRQVSKYQTSQSSAQNRRLIVELT